MSEELDLLKAVAKDAGYRFERDDRGVERIYRPDGSLALTAGSPIPEALPANVPEGVTQVADSTYVRTTTVTDAKGATTTIQARVCEDCWQVVPSYVDFPRGLVSPESDGDAGGNGAKTKLLAVGDSGKLGMAHLQKVVCLPCYLAAFARVYPQAKAPKLRALVIGSIAAYEPEPEADYVPEPKGAQAA